MKNKRWKPKLDEYYYYIGSDILSNDPIFYTKNCKFGIDRIRLKEGNYFKERKDCVYVLKCIRQSFKKNNWVLYK
jgi:hypothetical protein